MLALEREEKSLYVEQEGMISVTNDLEAIQTELWTMLTKGSAIEKLPTPIRNVVYNSFPLHFKVLGDASACQIFRNEMLE